MIWQILRNILSAVILLRLISASIFIHSSENDCDFSDMPEAVSAHNRAKSRLCKNEIKRSACNLKSASQAEFRSDDNEFRLKIYENTCPLRINRDYERVGEIHTNDVNDQRLLEEKYNLTVRKVDFIPNVNRVNICNDICVTYYHSVYFGFNEAVYDEKMPKCICFLKVAADYDFHALNFLQSPHLEYFYPILRTNIYDKRAPYQSMSYGVRPRNETLNIYNKLMNQIRPDEDELQRFSNNLGAGADDGQNLKQQNIKLPRIVFFLTVNQRTYRQILRLLKTIYDEHHYYFIHADKRSTYLNFMLANDLDRKIKAKNITNIKITKNSIETIWAGSSFLNVHLTMMKELLDLKKSAHWNWNYLINLSEADFPIKSVEDLSLFLSRFIKHNENVLSFYQSAQIVDMITNQAFEWSFLECEGRMWRLGIRRLPIGLQIEGVTDWFCFNEQFVDYLVNSKDQFLIDLKRFYNGTVFAPETFYHTVLANSRHCDKIVNVDIRHSNFPDINQRDRDCICDTIIDWCGCSPNFFGVNDFQKIQSMDSSVIFFARKFEPTFSMKIINQVDQRLFGNFPDDFLSLNSYWLNIFERGIDNFNAFESKYRLIFKLFREDSLKSLEHLISSSSNFKSRPRISFVVGNDHDQLRSDLKSIHHFFKDDRFEGFVFNYGVKLLLEFNNDSLSSTPIQLIDVDFESFYQMKYGTDRIHTILDPDFPYFNHSVCSIEHYSCFLEYFDNMIISTDMDPRKLRALNYAGIVDSGPTDPFFIIKFKDHVKRKLFFITEWINPLGQVMKHIKWQVPAGYYYERNVHDHLVGFKQLIDEEHLFNGIWHLRVIAEYPDHENQDFRKENIVLIYKFNVQPTSKQYNKLNDIYKHNKQLKKAKRDILDQWKSSSLCLIKSSSKLIKDLKSCHTDAYWSSFYPDPKSDINYGMKNH